MKSVAETIVNAMRDRQSPEDRKAFFEGVIARTTPLGVESETVEDAYDCTPFSEEVLASQSGIDGIHIEVALRHHEERIRRGEQ